MDISPGTVVGGKYLLERQLVRPGARVVRDRGSVWVAHDPQRGVRVALKLFLSDPPGAAAELLRIERGVRAAAGVTSPHVARVVDHGADGGVVYLAMELLAGEDLAARLLRRSRLSLQEAARVAAQAGEVLRRAHAADLLHQNLRPESLFLALDGGEEIVKVLDLGLAKGVAPRLADDIAAEANASALHYLSPEQIRSGRTLDTQTDLWSLAAVLFRAVTGQLPFPGEIASVVASKILLAPPPAATQRVPSLPAALDGFFEKAFARDLARRFRSVEEMVESFVRIAELAPPPSSGVLRPPPSARALAIAPARAVLAALAKARAAAAGAPAADVAAVAGAPGAAVAGAPAASISAPPIEVRRAAPDTQLSAERPEVPLEPSAPPARGRWVLLAGAVAVLGAAALATTSRLPRATPALAARTGAGASVLAASFAAREALPPRATPAAAHPTALRRAPVASPAGSPRAAATAPRRPVQPRPARPAPSAGEAVRATPAD
ncbi:protein kinase domain-containing protein [Sorangium sp. So ce131]|uniref:serine/threonine-protein kinase n=1 Tax=Sorangium sp. So ce131 TaxID=3133282 RepID=UPI003F5D831B